MKKVLLSIFVVLAFILPTNAATYDASSKVSTVGENLLTKNGIPATNVKFMVVSGLADNSSYITNKTINISTNDLTYAGNDNEVASVISKELGHIIAGHASKGKLIKGLLADTTVANTTSTAGQTASSIATNLYNAKEDKDADMIAVNLMVTAGYNPLASIVVLTKQTGTYWETIQGKPANADRALNIYNYVSFVYPEKLKVGYGCNEYRNFETYAKTAIEARKAIKKLENQNTKTMTKAQKTVANQILKFKQRGGISGWDAAYGLLNTIK